MEGFLLATNSNIFFSRCLLQGDQGQGGDHGLDVEGEWMCLVLGGDQEQLERKQQAGFQAVKTFVCCRNARH